MYYRCYRLTTSVAFIDRNADLSLQTLKWNVKLLYPTLEPFSGKDTMELLGFLSTMTKRLNGQQLSEGLATRALGFFLIGSTQAASTNVVHPSTHDPTRLPMTWPLIIQSLLGRFITIELLRKQHYAVTSAHIKQSETEMDFAEHLHDLLAAAVNCVPTPNW